MRWSWWDVVGLPVSVYLALLEWIEDVHARGQGDGGPPDDLGGLGMMF